MANLIGVKQGIAKVWADVTDYSSTISGYTRTQQIDLTSLAAGAARQGVKADIASIATTLNANRFLFYMAIEFVTATTLVAQEAVNLYWAGSPSATAGNANPGGTNGTDAAYTGTAGSSLDDSLLQLQFIGSLSITDDVEDVIQVASFVATLPHRYGMPVVVNKSAAGVMMDDAVQMLIAVVPLEDEAQ